jgi:hypothetical protein
LCKSIGHSGRGSSVISTRPGPAFGKLIMPANTKADENMITVFMPASSLGGCRQLDMFNAPNGAFL